MVATTVTGQLWYTNGQYNGAGNGDEAGVINSDGSSDTTLIPPLTVGLPASTVPWYTGIAVDTAAGYYWVVDNAIGPTTDPTAQMLVEYKFGNSTPIAKIAIAADIPAQDQTNDVVIDTFNHKLYVSTWGDDGSVSGIRAFSYNPTTGATTPITNGLGVNGDYVVIGDATGANVFADTAVSNVTSMSLDATNQRLYFIANDNGYSFAPDFFASNALYVVDLATKAVTQLTSSAQFSAGALGTGPFPDQNVNPNGSIEGVAVDVADGKVFFMTGGLARSGGVTPSPQLWYVSTNGGAGQTAVQVPLPAGVTLSGEFNYTSLSFDSVNRQLYINAQENSSGTGGGAVLVGQLNAGGTAVSSIVTTIQESALEPGALASYVPLGTDFVSLPVPVFTSAGTAAVERGSTVTLLGAASTSTDASNPDYVGATVKITGGVFSSNESSATDDHLTINGLASGSIGGISYSYNSALETLTLSGYDTVAHYNAALKLVQYSVTGNNPDNFGLDPTRTITWTLLDGSSNIPAGSQNSTTTTVAISTINSAPTLGGGGNAVTYLYGNAPVTIDAALTAADVDSANLFSATVTISAGFAAGDLLNFTTQNGITGVYSGGVLTLSGTATVSNYQAALRSVGFSSSSADPSVGGTDTSRTVSWQVNDGSGSNNLSNTTTSTVNVAPCYASGTLILTERGEIAVEDLAVGDRVVTASGALRPIVWIGHRKLVIARHPFPLEVLPVRVAAGAFAEGAPRRDLWLSPQHAVFVEGALIPIIRLANGATVAQRRVETVTYWHVELESHDVLVAEGLPAESFLDCGSRPGFANYQGFVELHPTFAPKSWDDACAPLRETGPEVEAVRRRLLARAEVLGFRREADPGLHLLVDGVEIWPATSRDGVHIFEAPAGGRDIRLMSRTWRPADAHADQGDRRHLGVHVTRLEIDGRAEDLAALGQGWGDLEGEAGQYWRWTNGSARLPAGARRIVVAIGAAAQYWVEPSPLGGFDPVRRSQLRVVADGAIYWPEEVDDGSVCFALPALAREIHLASAAFCPADRSGGASADRRRLGVAVTAISLDGQSRSLQAFGEGWHAVEGEPGRFWRWTDGFAALPAGVRRIELRVGRWPVDACEAEQINASRAA